MSKSEMTIVGSQRSPFVRICRLYMIQNNIECSMKVLNFVDDAKDAAELAKITPINKVPLLIDGDKKILMSASPTKVVGRFKY